MRTDIASVITLAVAATGCSWSSGGCEPQPEFFDSKDTGYESCSLESLEPDPGDSGFAPADECEEMCLALVDCARGGWIEGIEACRLTDESVACTVLVNPECTGRRPPRIVGFRSRSRSPLRRWATEAAWLEAASAPAFARLARELAFHGAPELAARARAAAREEARHARDVAATFGVHVPRVRVRPFPPRDLDTLAIDNAIEGSSETFGAAFALFQARHAAPRWRPFFRRIAADEARHAQLAWDIDMWLGSRARPDLRRYDHLPDVIPGLATPGPALGRRLAEALGASRS